MIIINGEKTELTESTKLLTWLERNDIDHTKIAVEYNGELLNRSDFGDIILKDGDRVEIVIFMGGG